MKGSKNLPDLVFLVIFSTFVRKMAVLIGVTLAETQSEPLHNS